MRLRITRQLSESIDGIHLSSFRRGYVYELGSTIANYLLAVRAAEPVEDDEPYIILPPEKQLFHPRPPEKQLFHPRPYPVESTPSTAAEPSVHHKRAEAADRAPRRGPEVAVRRSTRRTSDLPARVAALAAEIKRIKAHLEGLRSVS
jgi:hypothetical protein